MKPAKPIDLLRRIANSDEMFRNCEVEITSGSGRQYKGKWLECDAATFQMTLRDRNNDAVVWLDGSRLESISFPGASDKMLAVLSDYTFDPFLNADLVGDLELKRHMLHISEHLGRILEQNITVAIDSTNDLRDNIVKVFLIHLSEILTASIETMCSDEFSRSEAKRSIHQVRFAPATKNELTIQNTILVIGFAWTEPRERWTLQSLSKALNQAF